MSTEAERRAAELFDEYVDDLLNGKRQTLEYYLRRCPQNQLFALQEALEAIDFMGQYYHCPRLEKRTVEKLFQDVQEIQRQQEILRQAKKTVRTLDSDTRVSDPATYLGNLMGFSQAFMAKACNQAGQVTRSGFAVMNRGGGLPEAQKRVWTDETQLRGIERLVAPQAERVLRDAMSVERPVDVYRVADELGLFVQEVRLPEGQDGCIVTDGVTGGILISKLISDHRRRRFTLAHELGHFVLHKHLHYLLERVDEVGSFTHSMNELQANTFAGFLLLPPSLMPFDIGRGRPTLERADALVEDFDVSLPVALRRLVRESNSRCALVASYDGEVKWTAKGQDFDAFIKRRLYPDSMAALLLHADQDATRFPAHVWVEGSLAEEEVELWEESRRLESGFVYTLLTVIDPEY